MNTRGLLPRARGVAVTNIRDYCTPAVTQHVFALILALEADMLGTPLRDTSVTVIWKSW